MCEVSIGNDDVTIAFFLRFSHFRLHVFLEKFTIFTQNQLDTALFRSGRTSLIEWQKKIFENRTTIGAHLAIYVFWAIIAQCYYF